MGLGEIKPSETAPLLATPLQALIRTPLQRSEDWVHPGPGAGACRLLMRMPWTHQAIGKALCLLTLRLRHSQSRPYPFVQLSLEPWWSWERTRARLTHGGHQGPAPEHNQDARGGRQRRCRASRPGAKARGRRKGISERDAALRPELAGARLLISIEDTLNTVILGMEFVLFTQVSGKAHWAKPRRRSQRSGTSRWRTKIEGHPLDDHVHHIFNELELRMRKTLDATETGSQIRKEFMDQGLMSLDGQSWN